MKLKATIAYCLVFIPTLFAQPLNSSLFVFANSPYDELNPVLSPDGKTLYVTIANHPENIGGKRDPGDIWVCALTENNQWSEPVHGGSLLNNRAFNGVAGLSGDGSELFLLSHYDFSDAYGAARTQGISVSKNTGGGWAKPENISIPYFQNKSEILGGYLSPDKSFFLFSAETYGSYGVEDLYVSVRNNGKWSEPKNLGAKVNTQFQELSPSLSADGNTLYFSTNGRKGIGSFDIYSATRLDDSWTNWSEPKNMGPTVNSEGRELFYRVYPQVGFSIYTSTKNSDGYGDIKIFRSNEVMPEDSATAAPPQVIMADNTPVTAPAQITPVDSKPVENNVITVHGKVTNARTGEVIPAEITFQTITGDNNHKTASADPSQGYTIGISPTNSYSVRIESAGYISSLEQLDVQTYEMRDLEMNFKLQPIALGTTVNLDNVLFEQSKTALLPQSYEELDLVVSFMKANPKVRIELSGHTDNRGIPAQNVKLSQSRVDKVKEYLVSKGIEQKRIDGKGYGGSKPIASNNNEETRKLNRRVEFTIRKY